MPSVSAKQRHFMAAAAHDPGFAKRAGISQSVAREFNRADTRGYAGGGTVDDDIIGRGRGGVPIRGPLGFFTKELPGAMGGLWDALAGGLRGASKATLGLPGDLERLARAGNASLTLSENPLDAALRALGQDTLLPNTGDYDRWLPQGPKTPTEDVMAQMPLTPGQATRAVGAVSRPVLGALGKVAAEGVRRGVMEGRGPLGALSATAGPRYAVRPKGGNMDELNVNAYLNELGIDTGNAWVGERPGMTKESQLWGQKQLKNYLTKDLGSTTDPLLAVEAEGRGLHLPDENERLWGQHETDMRYRNAIDDLGNATPEGMAKEELVRAINKRKQHALLTNNGPLTPWGDFSSNALHRMKARNYLDFGDVEAQLDTATWPDRHWVDENVHGPSFGLADDPNLHGPIGSTLKRIPIMGMGAKHPTIPPSFQAAVEHDPENAHLKPFAFYEKNPDAMVHRIENQYVYEDALGLGHIMDYLNAAQKPGGIVKEYGKEGAAMIKDLRAGMTPEEIQRKHMMPHGIQQLRDMQQLMNAGLDLDPAGIDRLSMADAVRKTRDWNRFLEEQGRAGLGPELARGIKSTVKEYPGEGMKWVELGAPDVKEGLPEGWSITKTSRSDAPFGLKGPTDRDPGWTGSSEVELTEKARQLHAQQELEAGLNAEGKAMGHCVGGYCDEVASRGTRILSLRDAQNRPHVTVEVRPGGKPNPPGTAGDPHGFAYNEKANSDLQNLVVRHFGPHDADEYLHGVSADMFPHDELKDVARHMQRHGTWYPGEAPKGMEHLTDAQIRTKGIDLAQDLKRWEQQHPGDPGQPVIHQIKGKQNAAPVAKYLPQVQDLVKNHGPWGDVRDLGNAGLREYKGRYHSNEDMWNLINEHPRYQQMIGQGVERYPEGSMGHSMINKIGDPFQHLHSLESDIFKIPGLDYAHGGSVEDPAFADAWQLNEQPAFAKAWRLT